MKMMYGPAFFISGKVVYGKVIFGKGKIYRKVILC